MASEPSPSDSLDWGAAVDDEFYDYEENALGSGTCTELGRVASQSSSS